MSAPSPSPTRNLAAAREAAQRNDKEASRSIHEVTVGVTSMTQSGASKEEHKKGGELMKTCLFGGLDGIITTFAVVAGAGGGGLSVPTVLIMGFSSLVADALSMGVGDALSSKAEMEVAARERKREMWELDNFPEGEVKEMVEIYMKRGVPQDDAELIINTMAKHKDFFVDVMMHDELGMEPPEEGSMEHWRSGAYCFAAFFACGSVPLLGYVAFLPLGLHRDVLFAISCSVTAAALFVLGALKSTFTIKPWWHSGTEILVMGALTATAAYLIGWFVEWILRTANE